MRLGFVSLPIAIAAIACSPTVQESATGSTSGATGGGRGFISEPGHTEGPLPDGCNPDTLGIGGAVTFSAKVLEGADAFVMAGDGALWFAQVYSQRTQVGCWTLEPDPERGLWLIRVAPDNRIIARAVGDNWFASALARAPGGSVRFVSAFERPPGPGTNLGGGLIDPSVFVVTFDEHVNFVEQRIFPTDAAVLGGASGNESGALGLTLQFRTALDLGTSKLDGSTGHELVLALDDQLDVAWAAPFELNLASDLFPAVFLPFMPALSGSEISVVGNTPADVPVSAGGTTNWFVMKADAGDVRWTDSVPFVTCVADSSGHVVVGSREGNLVFLDAAGEMTATHVFQGVSLGGLGIDATGRLHVAGQAFGAFTYDGDPLSGSHAGPFIATLDQQAKLLRLQMLPALSPSPEDHLFESFSVAGDGTVALDVTYIDSSYVASSYVVRLAPP